MNVPLEYLKIKQPRWSRWAILTVLMGGIGTPSIWFLVGLWSIAVEGFEGFTPASQPLQIVWNVIIVVDVLIPVIFGILSIRQIKQSNWRLKGLALAILGISIPVLMLTVSLIVVWLRTK